MTNKPLNTEQTRRLVDHLHVVEMRAITKRRLKKPTEAAMYSQQATECYEKAMLLLKDVPDEQSSSKNIAKARQVLEEMIRGSVRFAYEGVVNLRLRGELMSLMTNLRDIGEKFEKELIPESELMTNVNKINQMFSEWMDKRMLSWKGFTEFNRTYTEKVAATLIYNHEPDFGKQLSQLTVERKELAMRDALLISEVLMVLIAGVMLWRIMEAKNPSLEAIKLTLATGATIPAFYWGVEAGISLFKGVSANLIFIGGVLGGVIAGFLVGVAAECLLEAVIAALIGTSTPRILYAEPMLYEVKLPMYESLSRSFVQKLTP